VTHWCFCIFIVCTGSSVVFAQLAALGTPSALIRFHARHEQRRQSQGRRDRPVFYCDSITRRWGRWGASARPVADLLGIDELISTAWNAGHLWLGRRRLRNPFSGESDMVNSMAPRNSKVMSSGRTNNIRKRPGDDRRRLQDIRRAASIVARDLPRQAPAPQRSALPRSFRELATPVLPGDQ